MDKKISVIVFFLVFGGLMVLSVLESKSIMDVMSGVSAGLITTVMIIFVYLVYKGELSK